MLRKVHSIHLKTLDSSGRLVSTDTKRYTNRSIFAQQHRGPYEIYCDNGHQLLDWAVGVMKPNPDTVWVLEVRTATGCYYARSKTVIVSGSETWQ